MLSLPASIIYTNNTGKAQGLPRSLGLETKMSQNSPSDFLKNIMSLSLKPFTKEV